MGKEEANQPILGIVHVREAGGLKYTGGIEDGEMWVDMRYVLEVE